MMPHSTSIPNKIRRVPIFAWFLLLAVTLHVALLLLPIEPPAPSVFAPHQLQLGFYQTTAVLAEPVQPQTQTTTTPKQPPKPKSANAVKTEIPTKLEPQIATALQTEQIAVAVATPPPADHPPATPNREPEPMKQKSMAKNRFDFDLEHATLVVNKQITQRIKNDFKYPFIARKKGWEGHVILEFKLTPKGQIDNIKIIRSSGHSMLDHDALETFNRIGSIDPLTLQELNWHSDQQLQLPIHYQLN